MPTPRTPFRGTRERCSRVSTPSNSIDPSVRSEPSLRCSYAVVYFSAEEPATSFTPRTFPMLSSGVPGRSTSSAPVLYGQPLHPRELTCVMSSKAAEGARAEGELRRCQWRSNVRSCATPGSTGPEIGSRRGFCVSGSEFGRGFVNRPRRPNPIQVAALTGLHFRGSTVTHRTLRFRYPVYGYPRRWLRPWWRPDSVLCLVLCSGSVRREVWDPTVV